MSGEKPNVAEAEPVENVEGNMLCTVMQGVTALPPSETPLRMKGRRRNLGDLASPAPASAVPGHDGKSMRRSRRGRDEESDGCIVPVMPRTKLVRASGGDGGGKAADRRKGERRRAPRAQNRNRCVTEAVNLRISGVQNRDHVRPSIGARCGKAARRDLRGGTGATRFPTATVQPRRARTGRLQSTNLRFSGRRCPSFVLHRNRLAQWAEIASTASRPV